MCMPQTESLRPSHRTAIRERGLSRTAAKVESLKSKYISKLPPAPSCPEECRDDEEGSNTGVGSRLPWSTADSGNPDLMHIPNDARCRDIEGTCALEEGDRSSSFAQRIRKEGRTNKAQRACTHIDGWAQDAAAGIEIHDWPLRPTGAET